MAFSFCSFSRHPSSCRIACALALCSAATAAWAGMVPNQWWSGSWNCTIDGRPAKMVWRVVDDTQVDCNGSDCTQSQGVRWSGRFSDNGSKWVALNNPRDGSQGGLYFTHADGNRWYLARPVGSTAKGWTTWNGQRYPLSCSR